MQTPEAPLSVLLLAGGRSRRMGRDKLWLLLDGAPLIERVARRLLPLAAEMLFSGAATDALAALAAALPVPARIVPDLLPDAGPLAGLHAGLTAARHDLVLALAGDLPFVNLELAAHLVGLAAGFDAVVPQTTAPDSGATMWEPLHAVYRRSCASAIAARLARGERRLICFLPDVRTRAVTLAEIARFDPAGRSFFNINTPDDWRLAQGL
jgi:molybdopterin-guanine dinucleotide biosynthesis protein A